MEHPSSFPILPKMFKSPKHGGRTQFTHWSLKYLKMNLLKKSLSILYVECSSPVPIPRASCKLRESCAIALAKKASFLVYLSKNELIYINLQRDECAEQCPGRQTCKGKREKEHF